ncbi:MAG: hypothetical protein NTX72_01685 [Candidatus Uhrbacteria bacterium]|nr:hypothetical protein [Candidatus Uhrbacteria bacterium]
MFLQSRFQFLATWDSLRPKVQRAFLAGKITYEEAQQFSTRSCLENKRLNVQVELLHTKRHEVLFRTHADINNPHKDIQALADELDRMPEHVAMQVMGGKLTLVQARFADRNKFGAKGVQDLCHTNTPTLPYRVRKFASGTEHSVRSFVQVRSRSRFAHPSSRRK